MAYTPQLSYQDSCTLRRIAWALKTPMTKAVGMVFEHLVGTIDAGKVCEECRDKTRCSDCVFNTKQEIQCSPLKAIQTENFSREAPNAKRAH